jgi:hypothetical protein
VGLDCLTCSIASNGRHRSKHEIFEYRHQPNAAIRQTTEEHNILADFAITVFEICLMMSIACSIEQPATSLFFKFPRVLAFLQKPGVYLVKTCYCMWGHAIYETNGNPINIRFITTGPEMHTSGKGSAAHTSAQRKDSCEGEVHQCHKTCSSLSTFFGTPLVSLLPDGSGRRLR